MKILAWCLGALVAALIILGASHFASSIGSAKSKTGIGLGNHPVIAEVEFDDFTRLQVLKLQANQLFDGPTKSSKKAFSFSIGSNGSTGEGLGNRFSVDSKTKNGSLISRHYTNSDAPTGLFLLVNSPNGTASTDLTIFNGLIRSSQGKERPKRDEETLAETFEQELLPTDLLPPFLLQLSDGAGGWHTANGPGRSESSTDDTSAMVFSTWPHTAKTLQFRVFIPGQPPETFSLPNPEQATVPEKWTPSAFPQTHRETDFTLTAHSAKLTKVAEQGSLLTIETEFSNRFPGDEKADYPWTHPLYRRDNKTLLNDWGHHATPAHLRIKQGSYQGGFLVPEDSNIFRLQIPIERTPYFPRNLSDVLIIGTAVVEPDGTTIRVTSKETALGLQKLTFSPLKKQKARQITQIETEFKWSSEKDKATKVGSHLDTINSHFFLFKDSETTSSGGSEFSGSNSGNSNREITEGVKQNWKGTIKPGQTFKVGIAMPHPIQFVDFTFDRSSL